MGGGTLLIFFLTFFLNVSQHNAQATNLIFFVPTSISATIENLKQKIVKLKLGISVSIFGCIGSAIGANISTKINSNGLKKYFGFFLLLITINEIYSFTKMYIIKQKKS